MTTGFYWDERCFWHHGGQYAFTLQAGGLVQPMNAGLPESPETKRRLKNLIEVTGLIRDLTPRHAPEATWDDLIRVHPGSFLRRF
jgi:acetoin utilization deacetylase AcuC-like enzyme